MAKPKVELIKQIPKQINSPRSSESKTRKPFRSQVIDGAQWRRKIGAEQPLISKSMCGIGEKHQATEKHCLDDEKNTCFHVLNNPSTPKSLCVRVLKKHRRRRKNIGEMKRLFNNFHKF